MTKNSTKRKRGKRGMGRLYKRDAGGTEHPDNWTGQGIFWLEYRVNGKRKRQALSHPDGSPITGLRDAEKERQRIVGPSVGQSRVDHLKDIQAKLRDAHEDLVAAEEAAAPGVQIGDAWDRYLASTNRPDTGEATLRQYGFQFDRFRRWIEAEHPEILALADVSPAIAREYAADLKSQIHKGTFNKHIRLLHLVSEVLASDACIARNPWGKENITRFRNVKQSTRREFTTPEMGRFVQSADGELKLLLALGVYTGLRLGDCCTLRWDEIDVARGDIVRVPNKTPSADPVHIPLFKDLNNMLREARLESASEYVLPEAAEAYQNSRHAITDHVQRHFLNCGIDVHRSGTGSQIERDKDGNPLRNDGGNVKLRPTGKRAVIVAGFHSLRHTFVSLCRQAGVPLAVVESIVGHSNPAMTRHYTHIGEIAARNAIDTLPSIVGSETQEDMTQVEVTCADPADALRSIKVSVDQLNGNTWQRVKAELMEVLDVAGV